MSSTSSTRYIHPPSPARQLFPSGSQTIPSPLPNLLHTPAGLALIEIQGTINHPQTADAGQNNIPIGRLEFPDYKPGDPLLGDDGQGKWMKRIWLFIGQHQRLTGEVRKLGKPLGVLRRKGKEGGSVGGDGMEDVEGGDGEGEDLEIVEVVRWKVVFSSRPEPVGVPTEL